MNEYPEWLIGRIASVLRESAAIRVTYDDSAEDVLDLLGFAPYSGSTYWRSDIQWEGAE